MQQREQLEQKQSEEIKLKDEWVSKKRQAVNLGEYQKQLAEIDRQFGALLKQLPNRSEMEALLVDINQAGPISRNWRSLRKLGFLPSMWWPMNWPIHATVKRTRQMAHRGRPAWVSKRMASPRQKRHQSAMPTNNGMERIQ